MSEQGLKETIQQKYGEAALRAQQGGEKGGCCGTSCGCGDPITSNLYGQDETTGLPDAAVAASLGCGNPTALIELQPGQTVLDLGSGGGIDVLLSARRVGADRQSLWSRHDRRDARARAREPAEGGCHERRVSQGRDRAHPIAGQQRRRHHLQLRHQPVAGQGTRAAGGVPRVETGRAVCRLGRCRPRRRARSRQRAAWSCGSAASPARCTRTNTGGCSAMPGSARSRSSHGASMQSTMPASSCQTPGSTSKGSPPMSRERSRAPSSVRRSRQSCCGRVLH